MLRIKEAAWSELESSLLARSDVETAGLLFAEHIEVGGQSTFAVRQALVLPEDAYVVRRPDQLEISPVALNRLTRAAREHKWSVFTIHSHPMSNEAWFSTADDAGDARLMPALGYQIPGVPHGSLVMARSGATVARHFGNSSVPTAVPVSVVGRHTRLVGGRAEQSRDERFDRQVLALGADGQATLRRLRVGVVGAGGTGSVVSSLLLHLGVGELLVYDHDLVEASNLSRILEATQGDLGRPKVEIVERYGERLSLGTKVMSVPNAISEADLATLASCDVVFSCVDAETPRALLNRAAYRFHLPVIDMGTAFRVDDTGRMTGDAGRVVIIGPDRPCLACWGDLDPHRLRAEALPQADRDALVAEGYVEGAEVAQPSVIAFNAAAASAAVVEMLRIFTHFAGSDDAPNRLAFSFSRGVVKRNALAGRRQCSICGGGSADD